MASSQRAVPPEQRLFSLVLALVASPIGATKQALLSSVYGYAEKYSRDGNNDSLERQFERDKEALRSLGINIETVDSPLEPGNNQLARYLISKDELQFPEGLQFSERELMLLRLAAQAWSVGSLSDESRRATMKLEALGSGLDVRQLGVAPMIGVAEPSGAALQRAIDEGRSVTFEYLLPGREAPASRTVAPLRLHRADGRWHLISWDLERDAGRVFLLSRIRSKVSLRASRFAPELRDRADELVSGLLSQAERYRAVVEVSLGSAAESRLAQRAAGVDASADSREQTTNRLTVATLDLYALAEELAGYGADVVAVSPPELRAHIVSRLRSIADSHDELTASEAAAARLLHTIDGAKNGASRAANLPAPDQVTLLLSIVGYLREHDETSIDELARVFGIDAKRLEERVIPFLGMAGVPGDTGTYQHEDLFDIDWQSLEERRVVRLIRTVAVDEVPRFAPAETAALIAGLQSLAAVLPEGDAQLARATAAKLGAALGGADHRGGISVTEEGRDPSLPVIVAAIEAGAGLAFQYRDVAERVTDRTIDPIALEQESGVWYVRGFCRDREADRTFRVERIRELRQVPGSGQGAECPAPTLADSDSDSGINSDVNSDGERDSEFSIVATIPEYILHSLVGFAPQTVGGAENGRVRVRIAAWHAGAAVRLVQQAPGDVLVEHPPVARIAVREWAERALAAYGE